MLINGVVSKGILPCLKSVSQYIDYYVIYTWDDVTNSDQDKNRKIIFDFFQDYRIPGEYGHYSSFRYSDYRFAMTKLIQYASRGKKDYLLIMNYYDSLMVHDHQFKKKLTFDAYELSNFSPSNIGNFFQTRLIHSRKRWKYVNFEARCCTFPCYTQVSKSLEIR